MAQDCTTCRLFKNDSCCDQNGGCQTPMYECWKPSELAIALDTIASKDTQITQLQDTIEKCREALQHVVDETTYKFLDISETWFYKVSEALQAIEVLKEGK